MTGSHEDPWSWIPAGCVNEGGEPDNRDEPIIVEDAALDEEQFDYLCQLEDEIEICIEEGNTAHQHHCEKEIETLLEKNRMF